MRTNKSLPILCLLAACALAAAPQPAEASCGALETATDGLCQAYCEEIDCDGAAGGEDADACLAVGLGYQQLAGTAPPCEPDLVCPCVDAFPAFRNMLEHPNDIIDCSSTEGWSRTEKKGNVEIEAAIAALTCKVVRPSTTQSLSITYEESQACVARIDEAIAASGCS